MKSDLVSVSEKLVREDIKKLIQNAEEIKKLKEQVEKQAEKRINAYNPLL